MSPLIIGLAVVFACLLLLIVREILRSSVPAEELTTEDELEMQRFAEWFGVDENHPAYQEYRTRLLKDRYRGR
jgi:hypothetical protein